MRRGRAQRLLAIALLPGTMGAKANLAKCGGEESEVPVHERAVSDRTLDALFACSDGTGHGELDKQVEAVQVYMVPTPAEKDWIDVPEITLTPSSPPPPTPPPSPAAIPPTPAPSEAESDSPSSPSIPPARSPPTLADTNPTSCAHSDGRTDARPSVGAP